METGSYRDTKKMVIAR